MSTDLLGAFSRSFKATVIGNESKLLCWVTVHGGIFLGVRSQFSLLSGYRQVSQKEPVLGPSRAGRRVSGVLEI